MGGRGSRSQSTGNSRRAAEDLRRVLDRIIADRRATMSDTTRSHSYRVERDLRDAEAARDLVGTQRLRDILSDVDVYGIADYVSRGSDSAYKHVSENQLLGMQNGTNRPMWMTREAWDSLGQAWSELKSRTGWTEREVGAAMTYVHRLAPTVGLDAERYRIRR